MGLSVFSVTPAGLLFVCVLCLAAEDTLFSALLLAAAVHELGHLAVMAAAGYRPERITLEWMGVSITCGLMPPGRELVTALAGPSASFLLATVAEGLARAGAGLFWYSAAGLSTVLGLFNLLPVWPLDGERALRAGLLLRAEPERAFALCRILSGALSVGLTALAAGLWARTGIWWPAGAALILLVRNLFLSRDR